MTRLRFLIVALLHFSIFMHVVVTHVVVTHIQ